jgi:hypothetical protein
MLSYQSLIDLDLFTEGTSKRMNDRAFVEELLAYLFIGLKDKKKSVTDTFKTDITDIEYRNLEERFKLIIDKIKLVCNVKAISNTRYKQKNDFYTFFSFVYENIESDSAILEYQYGILLVLDGKDKEGRQLIRPSNDECPALKEYANNCITQSNSKLAREKRMIFFRSVLLNHSPQGNEILGDILRYLSSVYSDKKISLKRIGEYELLDINEF